ncbi:MAG: glycosyltransferase [Cyclobacteriaceae bacterium]
MKKQGQHIIFLCPYPQHGAPSQRFRYEQYLEILTKNGSSYEIHSFFDEPTNRILYKSGHAVQKVLGVINGFLRRLLLIPRLSHADYLFIHREATPLGPPWLEWIIAKVLRKKIIYDFDDAIWLPDTSGVNTFMVRLKWQQKVASICRWSYKVSCGNDYLCSFAQKFNEKVILNPTTLDTERQHNRLKDHHEAPLTIGWTGSHSTMKYLKEVENVLQQLEQQYDFRFVVISNRPPELALKSLVYIPWQESTEVEDLLQLHIGLMPLPDDPWSRGKCGFKALQYLSLGIPALVSPVGVNTSIVRHGENGFHCSTEEDWLHYLRMLLNNPGLRIQMGEKGRKTVEATFSVRANGDNFLSLFS